MYYLDASWLQLLFAWFSFGILEMIWIVQMEVGVSVVLVAIWGAKLKSFLWLRFRVKLEAAHVFESMSIKNFARIYFLRPQFSFKWMFRKLSPNTRHFYPEAHLNLIVSASSGDRASGSWMWSTLWSWKTFHLASDDQYMHKVFEVDTLLYRYVFARAMLRHYDELPHKPEGTTWTWSWTTTPSRTGLRVALHDQLSKHCFFFYLLASRFTIHFHVQVQINALKIFSIRRLNPILRER